MSESKWAARLERFSLIFLNLTEHGFTRIFDALITLSVIWALPIEKYARIGLAQSVSAVLFVLFVSPEARIYRRFGEWKSEGLSSLKKRIHIYRHLCWMKILLTVFLSFAVPVIYRVVGIHKSFDMDWAWACLFTFGISFGPQILFADREFLRLELRFKAVNAITLFQKLSLLSGIGLVVALKLPILPGIGICAVISVVLSAFIARMITERTFEKLVGVIPDGNFNQTLSHKQEWLAGLKEIGLVAQVTGSIQNNALSMDLFMMGVYAFTPEVMGLYAAVWKVANLVQAIPVAIAGVFSVMTGRRDSKKRLIEEEWAEMRIWAFQLFGIGLMQAFVVYALRMPILHVLSKGRFSEAQLLTMGDWVVGLLIGSVFLAPLFVLLNWIGVRGRLVRALLQIYVPWGIFCYLLYGWVARDHDAKKLAYLSGIAAIFALARALGFIRREIRHQIHERELAAYGA